MDELNERESASLTVYPETLWHLDGPVRPKSRLQIQSRANFRARPETSNTWFVSLGSSVSFPEKSLFNIRQLDVCQNTTIECLVVKKVVKKGHNNYI